MVDVELWMVECVWWMLVSGKLKEKVRWIVTVDGGRWMAIGEGWWMKNGGRRIVDRRM